MIILTASSVFILSSFSAGYECPDNKSCSLIGVAIDGGHIIVIATLNSSNSYLNASKNPVTANFELQYGTRKGRPTSPDMDDITSI